MKIYVPDTSYACYVVQSEEVIRAYKTQPRNNTTVTYRDYYIRSDYIYKDGTQTFGSTTTLPTCLATSVITNEVYYRQDFVNSLLIFVLLVLVCFGGPLKIFLRMFKRFR